MAPALAPTVSLFLSRLISLRLFQMQYFSTGLTRDIGVAPGAPADACIFNAFILTDQTGVMRIEISNDNITWRRATIDTAIAANVPLFISAKVVARYHRVVIVNGATIQGLVMINTSYTSA